MILEEEQEFANAWQGQGEVKYFRREELHDKRQRDEKTAKMAIIFQAW